MLDIYVTPFYAISVSTQQVDADAHMSVMLADCHGPLVSYDHVYRQEECDGLVVRTVHDVPIDTEPLVSLWARCARQLPVPWMPQANGEVERVSVSVHECADDNDLKRSRLAEHLVAYRRGSRLVVEFSDDRQSIDVVSLARENYTSPYELAIHAAAVLLLSDRWTAGEGGRQ
jgi:hypothetical protein